jgi:hypothetical protein
MEANKILRLVTGLKKTLGKDRRFPDDIASLSSAPAPEKVDGDNSANGFPAKFLKSNQS